MRPLAKKTVYDRASFERRSNIPRYTTKMLIDNAWGGHHIEPRSVKKECDLRRCLHARNPKTTGRAKVHPKSNAQRGRRDIIVRSDIFTKTFGSTFGPF